jgi:hypothetical protein
MQLLKYCLINQNQIAVISGPSSLSLSNDIANYINGEFIAVADGESKIRIKKY